VTAPQDPTALAAARQAYAAAQRRQREEQITQHLGLLRAVARRIGGSLPPGSVELEELVSWGAIGLIRGVDRYDPARGVPLEAYLRRSVRLAIMEGLRTQDVVPRRLRERQVRLTEAFAELEQRLMRAPSDREVADHLGLSEEELGQWYRDLSFTVAVRLDGPAGGEEEGGSPLLGFVADPEEGPEGQLEQQELRQRLRQALARLSERERKVLAAVYQADATLAETARVMGLSPSYVARLHMRAIFRLRGMLSRYVAEARRGPSLRGPPGAAAGGRRQGEGEERP
jgi:RNA polymerase sigma factor for flagellar operon FliA